MKYTWEKLKNDESLRIMIPIIVLFLFGFIVKMIVPPVYFEVVILVAGCVLLAFSPRRDMVLKTHATNREKLYSFKRNIIRNFVISLLVFIFALLFWFAPHTRSFPVVQYLRSLIGYDVLSWYISLRVSNVTAAFLPIIIAALSLGQGIACVRIYYWVKEELSKNSEVRGTL